MIRVAGIALSAAAAVAGFGAGHFALTLTAPPKAVPAPAAVALAPAAEEAPSTTDAGPVPWPEAFGSYVAPAPPPPPPAAAPPPPPPPAPLFAEGYSLTGFVSTGSDRWAIVRGGFGEILVRVGDKLTQDSVVVAIDEQGVWLDTPAGRELIGFD